MTERWTPHATVATVIEHQGRFLMVKEVALGAEVINQPAGHVEQGETIVAAAVREALEETGWEVAVQGLVGLYIYTAPANGITYHRYCFCGSPVREVPDAQLDDGIVGPVWMTIEELRTSQYLRSPMVLTCVEDYLKGTRYPLSVIVEHP
ncbi:NUDIX hydrolase [Thalassolituus sp. LLYu03]|uniref:NUDIX hydrolase n=1 Tax=Thalassolituus sp. LLYu03 TaxID=3421656 RepID=UPI003D286A6B